MTREKAYEILDKHNPCTECDGSFPYNCNECGEAFLTAFDALKQPEIVRCKDCKNSIEPCNGWDRRCKIYGVVRDDFFCGDGKPKEGGHNG